MARYPIDTHSLPPIASPLPVVPNPGDADDHEYARPCPRGFFCPLYFICAIPCAPGALCEPSKFTGTISVDDTSGLLDDGSDDDGDDRYDDDDDGEFECEFPNGETGKMVKISTTDDISGNVTSEWMCPGESTMTICPEVTFADLHVSTCNL